MGNGKCEEEIASFIIFQPFDSQQKSDVSMDFLMSSVFVGHARKLNINMPRGN